MRYSLLIISPLIALFFALSAHATAAGPNVPIKRFAIREANPSVNLTEREAYVRDLTRRRPTRRSTAQRRQASEGPGAPRSTTAGGTNSQSGSSTGDISLNGNVLGFDGATQTLTTDYNAGWSPRTGRRIATTVAGYPNLALTQVGTNSVVLGPGSANFVLLSAAGSPTTAGSVPTTRSTLTYGNVLAETDVWSINYSSGAVTAQWTNPDGSSPITYLLSDGIHVAATGDPNAFNTALGGGWFPITLTLDFGP